jgi:hypothetical protein
MSTPDGDNWHPNEKHPKEFQEKYSDWFDESAVLKHWFAMNCNWNTPLKPMRLTCIPLGLENRFVPGHYKKNILNFNTMSSFQSSSSSIKILVDFSRDDHWKPDRGVALDALEGKEFISRFKRLPVEEWQFQVKQHPFVACPHGHGADTHRLWEVLLLGSYPIVKTSPLNELYENLPVLIVNNWSEITFTMLENVKNEFDQDFTGKILEKIWFPFWESKIRSMQETLRNKS